MASIFGHGIVSYTIAKLLSDNKMRWIMLAAIVSSILPDIDVITFYLGVPYSHPFGHRGFTHSILFALLWALLLMFSFSKSNKLMWFLVIFLCTIFHGILDAMTSGGRGVGFFIPFNNTRFFFPFREILVSPIHMIEFFSEWGVQVILSEIKYLFLPSIFILAVRFYIKKI